MDLNSFEKSIWQERHRKGFHFFCALCSKPRRSSMHPNPYQPRFIFRVAVTAAAVAFCLSPWMSWKGLVAFFPLWVTFETIYRSKARLKVECPHCGFDPYLYSSRPEAANARVKEHFRNAYEEKGIPYPPEAPKSSSRASRKTVRPAKPAEHDPIRFDEL